MRLAADRAERHGARLEALHDLEGWLDLVDRDRRGLLELQEAADRAEPAALVVHDHFDLTALFRHLSQRLPAYARPLFIRIRPALDITETFKQKKQSLISEGFDLSAVSDALYFEDAVRGAYVPLDANLHARIADGVLRI